MSPPYLGLDKTKETPSLFGVAESMYIIVVQEEGKCNP